MQSTMHHRNDGTAVYLVDQGLSHLAQEDVALCVYDDATAQLLVVKGGCVFAYDALAQGPHSLRWMYPLQEGPQVRTLRPSPDNKLLALQRSATLIELVDLETGNCFVHTIHKAKGDILAVFFSEAPEVDFVVITTRAVELLQFAAKRQGLRMKERVRMRLTWCTYTHDTRMFVAAMAPASTQLLAWQLTAAGITRLPPFELRGPLPLSSGARELFPAHLLEPPSGTEQQRAAARAAGAPAAAAAAAAGPATAATIASAAVSALSGGPSAPAAGPVVVSQASVSLLKVYGRVYLAHVSSTAGRLELYRVYTDTIILQHLYELYAPEVVLSVVDNVIVVHHPATAVVMLLDVALEGSGLVANPLPLKRLEPLAPGQAAGKAAWAPAGSSGGAAGTAASDAGSSGSGSGAGSHAPGGGSQNAKAPSQQQQQPQEQVDKSGEQQEQQGQHQGQHQGQQHQKQSHLQRRFTACDAHHSASWRYSMPNVVLDAAGSTLYRLHLDLCAIADSSGDAARLVGFLQRRRSPPVAPLATDVRALLLSVVKGALQERAPMAVLRGVFNHLNAAYADVLLRTSGAAAAATATATAAAAAAGEAAQHLAAPPPPVTVITPNELAVGLFKWAQDEEVVDSLYLQAAVTQYRASVEAVGVPLPLYLQRLSVDVLLQGGQQYQAVQLLASQPGMGLGLLAMQEQLGLSDAGQHETEGRSHARGAGLANAVAVQLALDVGARQACLELQQAAASGGSSSSSGSSRAAAEAHVVALLAQGRILCAVRLARAHSVGAVAPLRFLEAAAKAGDAWAFAAVYRECHGALRIAFPTLAAARQHCQACLAGAGAGGGQAAAAGDGAHAVPVFA